MLTLCVCLVLTSCASLPTTPTRSCTRCWSWPSARAVRVLACSDSSINWHCGFTHTRDQHCSTALVSCIRSHLTGGLVGTLTLSNKYPLSRWAAFQEVPGVCGESRMNSSATVYKIFHFCIKKKRQKWQNSNCWKRVFGQFLFPDAKVCLVLYAWETNNTRAKALSITITASLAFCKLRNT